MHFGHDLPRRNEGQDHAAVRDPRAYLVRIVTRLALNRMRTLARRRETYVGPWLPEPIDDARLPDEAAEIADSLTRFAAAATDADDDTGDGAGDDAGNDAAALPGPGPAAAAPAN